MEAKDKAKELVDKYRTYIRMADKYGYILSEDEIYLAKQCALIAVDEILNLDDFSIEGREYWQEVKQEINYNL